MDQDQESREFVRIEVGGRVLFRRLEGELVGRLRLKIANRDRGEQQSPDRQATSAFEARVLNRLDAIEAKVDAILESLNQRPSEEKRSPLDEGSLINLSAAGVIFEAPLGSDLTEGDFLELQVLPVGYYGPPVLTLSRINRIEDPDEKGLQEIAVAFEMIGVYDQEKMVGYTFRHLRRQIQKEQREK